VVRVKTFMLGCMFYKSFPPKRSQILLSYPYHTVNYYVATLQIFIVPTTVLIRWQLSVCQRDIYM